MEAKEFTAPLGSPAVLLGWHAIAQDKANPEAEVAKRTGQGYSSARWSPFPSPDGWKCSEAESSFPVESPALGTASVMTTHAHWTGCLPF